MAERLKAPWPWFGGKSRIANAVWRRLGAPDNYLEPFCGSAAVLLGRPTPPRIETVNDATGDIENFWRATDPVTGDAVSVAEVLNDDDPYLTNAWRSIRNDPVATAAWADYPVSECYLHAAHRWLLLGEGAEEFRHLVRTDPDYFDPKRAGRWIFGLCCWIGSGWCSAADLTRNSTATPALAGSDGMGQGVVRDQRVELSGSVNNGSGGHAAGPQAKERRGGLAQKVPNCDRGDAAGPAGQIPMLSVACGMDAAGDGEDGRRPQLADAYARGRGVHGNDAAGTCAARRAWLVEWFGRLRDRLRAVRVCCGDWKRVCWSESVTTRLGATAIFFDPPYAHSVARMLAWVRHLRHGGPEPAPGKADNRAASLYSTDGADVDRLVAEVHLYCLERGRDPNYRIALCGYAGEHDALEAEGWEVIAWKGGGGYGNRSEKGKANAGRERIWFSPHARRGKGLFDEFAHD